MHQGLQNYRRAAEVKSPDLKVTHWLEKRFVIGKYYYSVKNILMVLLSLAAVAVVIMYTLFFYRNYLADPNVAMQREINSLTLKIGRYMELPKGEQPTLATVTDRDKLKSQDFFANAKNGDKLLIYPHAQRAILYRPSTEKIIEVTNLTSGGSGKSDSQPSNQGQ